MKSNHGEFDYEVGNFLKNYSYYVGMSLLFVALHFMSPSFTWRDVAGSVLAFWAVAVIMLSYDKDKKQGCQSCKDYEQSFELYDKASKALMHAYKKAHPQIPEDVWPDATKVNVWAAHMIEVYVPVGKD